eukprot:scaffold103530_cov55-Phaeocystis_antarctica.AAC.2
MLHSLCTRGLNALRLRPDYDRHTDTSAHDICDKRLRFIPRTREPAAAHRRSTLTRSCSAAAGCPAAAANGRAPKEQ